MDVKVFGISTDNSPSQDEFAKKNNIEVPMLSDFKDRAVSKLYGVLMDSGMANRVTFVIDKEGKIVQIEEGTAALDPTGAETACSRSAHKAQ
jgi:peroxiredoxin